MIRTSCQIRLSVSKIGFWNEATFIHLMCWFCVFPLHQKTVCELKDELRTLNQQLQIQESKFSTQNLEKQALEEQLEMQRK